MYLTGLKKENKNRDFIKLRKNYSGNGNKKGKEKFAKINTFLTNS